MSAYKIEKKVTVRNVAELQNALRDEAADQPITATLGGPVMLRWLKDKDTDEVIIEVNEDASDDE